MPFFLLGLGRATGDLRLIASEVYESRQQALAALATISSGPGFEQTDAEVFVVDLDTATPVLLVAPAAPVPEPDSEIIVAEPEAPVTEPEPAAPEETAGVWETPSEPVEPAIAEAVEAEAAEEAPSLRDALAGAAGSLEASGITAPESVQPEDEPSAGDAVVEPAADEQPAPAAWPWDASSGEQSSESSAPEHPAEAEIAVEEQVGDQVESELDTAEEPEPDAEPEPEPDAELEADPEQEPEPEAVAEYVPSPLEEPAIDGGESLIGASAEDAFSANRPVILGAYDEAEPEPEPAPKAASMPEQPTEVAGLEEAAAKPAVDVVAGPAVDPADVALEDALADLAPIAEVAPPAAENVTDLPDIPGLAEDDALDGIPVAPAAEGESDAPEMTCDECVYVNTCPNKDDRDPTTCGSFQWKSIV